MTEMQTFSCTLQATMADVGNDLKNWGLIRRWRSARGKVEKKSRQIINNENAHRRREATSPILLGLSRAGVIVSSAERSKPLRSRGHSLSLICYNQVTGIRQG
jgi:hypothetical protein